MPTLLAGTDLGILTSKERQPLPEIISTVHVEELLEEIGETDDYLELGAATTRALSLTLSGFIRLSLLSLLELVPARFGIWAPLAAILARRLPLAIPHHVLLP